MRNDTLKKRCIPILAVAASLILASLSCTSIMPPTPTPTPTETSTPTDTPTPTNTPTITPTFTPSMTPTESYTDWPVVLSDSFEDNSNGWFVGPSNSDLVNGVVSITDGQYLVDITALKGLFWALTPTVRNLSDFYLTTKAELKDVYQSFNLGLAFRIASDNEYYFGIIAEGQMYSVLMLKDGSWTKLIDWTDSSQISITGSNQIAVLARGTSFTFFINGEQVDQTEDSTLKSGKVGVGFSLPNAGDKAQFAFDSFEVQAP